MALQRYPGFCGPSYTSQSKIAAFDRSVNWYCEKNESGTGQSPYSLYPAPGYATGSAVAPTSPGRAIFALNGVIYAIYGGSLYIVSGDGVILKAQGLNNPDGGVAQILGNGDAGHQLLIRAGTTMYALDLNAPIASAEPLDPPESAPSWIASLNTGNQPVGFLGYSVTFVTAAGETTAGPRLTIYSSAGLGGTRIGGLATGASVVTGRRVYRTTAQVSAAAALTAPLQLLTTLADNTTTDYTDDHADGDLGALVPVSNTATVAIEALTTIPYRADQIGFINGYGLALDITRSELRFSALLDFSSWDALDVAQRNDAADKWLGMLVHHKEVWLFGTETTSVYWNSGDADTPFQPIPSVFIPVGIIAPNSACVVDGSPMWIGQGTNGAGVVYRANGYTPERISTHAVELALQNTSYDPAAVVLALSFAEGSTYQENGHVFYEITIPSLADGTLPGSTWVYDATAGLWHERGQFNGLTFFELDTRGHAQVNSAQYTVSRTSGRFYAQSTAYYVGTDGLGVVRLRRAPHVNHAQLRTRFSHFRLLMETGVGLAVGQGSDPQVALRWSDDGGQTWSASYTESAGKIGEYATLVDWRQLGQGRDRVFEVTVSDPVPWRLLDAFLDASVGSS